MRFDLTTERWVLVLSERGVEELSLAEVLIRSHEITSLAGVDPLTRAALLRFLLAVLVDAAPVASEREWSARLAGGRLPEDRIRDYLEDNQDRFDLFSDSHPFFQVPGLEPTSGKWGSPALLLPDLATGNNVPLFSAAPEDRVEPLPAALAARQLIACHAWDTAAIKSGAKEDPQVKAGKTTGNPTGPLGALGLVIPLGRTLFETLVLNTPVTVGGVDDAPAWRRDASPAWAVRPAIGILDLLTWQSRRIRLLPEPDDEGRPVVRYVLVAAGDRLESTPPFEPHTVWKANPRKGGPAEVPARHAPGKAAWRGISALLELRQGAGGPERSTCGALRSLVNRASDEVPVDALVVGAFYGNQSAVIEDTMGETVPVPLQAFGDPDVQNGIDEAVTGAELCARALNGLQGNLRRAAGGESIPWDKGQRAGEVLLADLDATARRLLGRVRESPERLEELLLGWEGHLWRSVWDIADPLLDNAPPPTFRGRIYEENGREQVIRLNVAEAFLRGALNKALPRLHAERLAVAARAKTLEEVS